jgi:hypothetical protein
MNSAQLKNSLYTMRVGFELSKAWEKSSFDDLNLQEKTQNAG